MQPVVGGRLFSAGCIQFDEPQDDIAVAFAGLAHGPHAIDQSRFDLDETLAAIALHGPPRRALGQLGCDGLVGHIGKGDTNHLRVRDRNQAEI